MPDISDTPLLDKLPGGRIVTTDGVLELARRGIPVHFIDVSGEAMTPPNVVSAPWVVQPGSPYNRVRRMDEGIAVPQNGTLGVLWRPIPSELADVISRAKSDPQ